MNPVGLVATARTLVADGKGILAADETPATLTKRFDRLKIPSNPESRRDYRELLFTTPEMSHFISGVILQDETIRQESPTGGSLSSLLTRRGIIPGIKVDAGMRPFPGPGDQVITTGLEGLGERLKNYHALGAQFAKWRAVIRVSSSLPTEECILANADGLGRYAAICQEEGIVPIVEPEVLMEGAHTIDRCSEVTTCVLHSVFEALYRHHVTLEGMLLKPNMVVPGSTCPVQASPIEVAGATLLCLRRCVPAAVPGIVFLSGGQTDVKATVHLNAIALMEGPKPWKISFSYGRALQDRALATWLGNRANSEAAQNAFSHRARCNAAATLGKYTPSFENETRERTYEYSSEAEDD